MARSSYRGVVQGGAIVLLDADARLAEGMQVMVTPVAAGQGNGAALVAALDAAPRVPKEWVEELERVIQEGERPPLRGGVFPVEQDGEERP
jgi:hypothetical protein